jgi:multiple sugar transport system permease protein
MTLAATVRQPLPALTGAGSAVRHLRRALWLAPLGLSLLVVLVYPLVLLIGLAMTSSTLGRPFNRFVGLDQIVAGLLDPVFQAAVFKSVAFGFVASALQLAAGFGIALLLTEWVRAGRLLLTLVLLPLMTPPVIAGIAWKLILAPAGGLLNGQLMQWGLIEAPISFLGTPGLAWLSILAADFWQWTPFVVILSFAALMGIPPEMREASLLDGATPLQHLVHVTLPLVAAPLASIFLLKLIIAFKLFDLVHVLTFGGPGFDTTNASFWIWRSAFERFDVGRAAAATIVYAAVLGLVTLPVVHLCRRLEARR